MNPLGLIRYKAFPCQPTVPNIARKGDELLCDITRFLKRFLALPMQATVILPVWALHTYIFDKFACTPYLNIISPEPGCGKTTTGEALSAISCRATSPTCGTAAVLRRVVANEQPTLIVDEWDSLDNAVRKSCMNFLNTGFKKGGTYRMMEGSAVVELSTFCPKAIIGRSTVKLAEATLTRCIPFMIHKAVAGDGLEKFREAHKTEAGILRLRCEDWAEEFRSMDVAASPVFPGSFDGRQQDISEPLLVIADLIGGEWPQSVREALATLLDDRYQDEITPENQLLRAVRKFVDEMKIAPPTGWFWSEGFVRWLNRQEHRPWSEKPMTTDSVAKMLKTYGIRPQQLSRTIAGIEKNHRGYLVTWFKDAFERYT